MNATFSIPGHLAYGGDEPDPSRPAGQDILDAVYNTVHGYPGGVTALAARMGIPVNTLTHKANPNTTTHQPNPRELIAMQAFSGNFAVLHAMAEALGHTCTLATPDQSGADPVEALMRLHSVFADYVRATADAVREGEGAVTGNQVRRADYAAQEVIAAVGHVMALLRGRMRKAPQT
jgi:hypothetical protein